MDEPQQIGRYMIEQELGRGGMAIVYLAHDPVIARLVAVKVLPRQFTYDPHFLTRFKREAEVIAALEHPAIVPVYDFGDDDGQPFIVMRFMRGGDLESRLRRGPLTLAQASEVLERLAPALDEAHLRQIVHRDLKPGNILFDKRNKAYLSDFGIVKLAQRSSVGLSTTGGALGTPAYMSPEQALATSRLDGRSDVYALGIVLFEMLTGAPPYDADTPMGLAMMHLVEPVPRILPKRPDLPPATEAVISRSLAKERRDRFATAGEMAMAVAELCRDTNATYLPAGPTAGAVTVKTESKAAGSPWSRRIVPLFLGLLSGTGAFLLLIALIAAFLFWRADRPAATATPALAVASATVKPAGTVTPANSATGSSAGLLLTRAGEQTATATTASGAPLPTPTLAPQLRASEDGLRLRAGPSELYPTVVIVSSGTTLLLLARNTTASWYLVSTLDDVVGWVPATAVVPVGILPVVIPLATSPPLPPTSTPRPARPSATPAPANTSPPPPPATSTQRPATSTPHPPATNTPAPPTATPQATNTTAPPPTDTPEPTPGPTQAPTPTP